MFYDFDSVSNGCKDIQEKPTFLAYKDVSENFLYEYLQKTAENELNRKDSIIKNNENLICIKKNSKFKVNKKYDLSEIVKKLCQDKASIGKK